jgi:Bacterial TSP3 repeat
MICYIRALVILTALLFTCTAAPLVNFNDTWHYRKGTSAPQSDWKTAADASLDVSWLTGAGWIGYGDGSGANAAGTTLGDMRMVAGGAAGYRTFYMRKTFTIPAGTPPTDEVVLDTDFDDGFIAWIGGAFVDSQGTPGAPAEPSFVPVGTMSTHECSFGNGTQSPVRSTVLGTVGTNFPPGTYVLAAMCLNESLTSSDAVLKMTLSTRTPVPPLTLRWTIAQSPIVLSATFNVAANEELIIDPGVEVRCHSGSDAITCAGKIIAVGTQAQPIRFVRASAGSAWRRIVLTGTQESVFKWCDFDGANTSGTIRGSGTSSVSPKVHLENCRWLNTDVQMVDLVYTSCNIINCEFDSIGAQELIHFSNMPANGYALIKGCRFGLPGVPPTSGYNDIVDFTGGNRPGPIARFIDNVFLSSVDDCFDMDATDAHIEGNIFLNVLQGSPRDSSSNPITTGEGSAVSELVIARNYFYNCEHLLLLKDSGAAVLQNNTFLKMVTNPNAETAAGNAIPPGIILFGEPWRGRPLGAGAIYEGNIAWDLAAVIQATPFPLYDSGASYLRVNRSLIQGNQWPGTGNITADPIFVSTTGIDYTTIRNALQLQAGSPAIGTGPNGLDMGASVPAGASVGGAPSGTVSSRDATLTVGGPGIWVYRWRLNGGAWSANVPLVPASVLNGGVFTAAMYDNPTPITLTNLPDGTHTVEVVGQNSGGDWQETPVVRTWTVFLDSDNDQLPDSWEIANNLNPNNPADAVLDTDGDGLTNEQEYAAGTNPQNSNSRFTAVAAPTATPGEFAITFNAVAGKSYTVRYKDDITAATWSPLQHFGPQTGSGPLTALDMPPVGTARRFYQVVTPQKP